MDLSSLPDLPHTFSDDEVRALTFMDHQYRYLNYASGKPWARCACGFDIMSDNSGGSLQARLDSAIQRHLEQEILTTFKHLKKSGYDIEPGHPSQEVAGPVG